MNSLRNLFWQKYPLDQLNSAEWEALCDGCAKCCLLKITDEASIFITNISCANLKVDSCRCSDYLNREKNVKDCLKLTKENLQKNLKFLPSSCSYRLIAERKPLPEWHYLISKDKESVHKQNQSIQDYCISEALVKRENYEDHILAEITEES
ncbi:YcgN family cysteine cluster protein [Paracoccaceae bacterium]|nr:YcgN family cysteine cluster protein [Paracoccaceae bacterium]